MGQPDAGCRGWLQTCRVPSPQGLFPHTRFSLSRRPGFSGLVVISPRVSDSADWVVPGRGRPATVLSNHLTRVSCIYTGAIGQMLARLVYTKNVAVCWGCFCYFWECLVWGKGGGKNDTQEEASFD